MKILGGRELNLWPQFFRHNGGNGAKMLRRDFCSQGSGVSGRGHGSGFRGQYRGQMSRFGVILTFF